LHQGMPEQVARMLLDDVAEIGLATEALAGFEELVTLPCYEWQHVMVVPTGHPLAAVERPTLEQLAAQPLVLYHATVTGRSRIDQAFARARLKPQVALEAIDSDVIKTYVRLGLGVGVVTELAVRDDPLAVPGGELACHPRGLQARRLPAAFRACFRRTAVATPQRCAHRTRDGWRWQRLHPVRT